MPAPSNIAARRFALALLAGLATLAAAAAALVWWVDPFQQYRLATRHPPRFYPPLQRYVNPGLAKHADYDRVIIGSSMMENVVPGDVDALFGGHSVSLCLSAISAYEMRVMLETAFAARPVRHVILSVDYNSLSGTPRHHLIDQAFPHYLYDRNRWNDFRYLLSGDAVLRALETLLDWRIGWARYDPSRPWFWGHEYRFGARETVARLDPDNLNRDFRQPPRTFAGMRASFDENLLALIRAHPQTRFSVVLPPYSVLVWADFVQRGQLDVTLQFKRYLLEALGPLPNVDVHDFQADPALVDDLSLYKDMYHYSPAISRWLVQAVRDGSYRVAAGDAEAAVARQRTLALGADPKALIEAARRAP